MLSSEGNENGEKTTVCLISRKATLHVQPPFFVHFLCRSFPRLQRETSRNFLVTRFMEKMSTYLFLMSPLIFTLVAASTSRPFSFPHRRYKIFMLFFKQKMSPLLFISCFSSLALFFSLSLAVLSRTFSVFLFLYICFKFVYMTIFLILIL